MRDFLGLALAMADHAEEMKPAARKIVDAMKLFGPEVSEILDGVSDYLVDRRAAEVNRMQSHGFTREDAIMLVVDINHQIARTLREQANKTPGKK